MFSRRHIFAVAAVVMMLAGCSQAGAKGGAAEGDMTLGDMKAKVQLVEYASASCVHCAKFNNEVFPAFKAKYIDTGKVGYTMREFLTPPAEVAAAGFLISRCAGKDKYFTVLDSVYKNQMEMFETGDFRGVLLRIAQSAGMTEPQFNACVSDEKALTALQARVDRAVKQDKINSTPTFIINGKKIAEGEVTMAQLDAAVAAASK
jgi:protein-disulfide isomerase